MGQVLTLREGRYAVLQADIEDRGLTSLGIVLEDPESNRVYIRLRRDWDTLSAEDPVLPLLEEELKTNAAVMGGERFFAWIEENVSANLRTTDRQTVTAGEFEQTLNRLYASHIHSEVRAYETHVPLLSLRVAAGAFLENDEVEPEGWIEVPSAMSRLGDEFFAATITGTSMEPYIPNGSVCLFRRFGAGSRHGKRVLVQELGRGDSQAYTVKVYRSQKRQLPDGAWRHDAIYLEPLNPDHEGWYLEPNEETYAVIAEFVKVLY